MRVYNDDLLTSDWHVLHHNIYWQLPEERKTLSGGEFFRPSGKEKFYAAERAIYQKLFDRLKELFETNAIKRLIHLGDFCFLNKRCELSPGEEIQKHIPVILELFEYLQSKNIPTVIILGNHDQPEKKDRERGIDEAVYYLWKKLLYIPITRSAIRWQKKRLSEHLNSGITVCRKCSVVLTKNYSGMV